MALSDDDVREILRLIDDSKLDELRIETAEFRLHVQRGGATPPAPALASTDGARTIHAPMPGTFYRADRPGAEPFVDVGTKVEPDTVVCLIEIMKMMNTVEAGVAGTVVEVCAENAQLVKDGEPLFKVA
jgi:acetyl-CoA carboxylase biotin carboxyl carrier protein